MRGIFSAQKVGVLVLACSVSVNVLQAQKIRSMASGGTGKGATVGTKATPIDATATDGRPIRIAFDNGLPTVLYYFSPTCGWCNRNWKNLEALAASAEGRYRVVALTSDRDMKTYIAKHNLAVEVLEGLGVETLEAYRFTVTPHTVVVDATGLVTHEWRGAFRNGIADKIEDLFGLVLPGVSPGVPSAQ